MTASDPRTLKHHLGTITADSRTDLVADLWRARGFDVVRDGDVLVATRGGESIAIHVVRGFRIGVLLSPDRETDVVVAPGGSRYAQLVAARHDARLVDAGDLYELFQYALDPTTATALCERYFDAPFDDLRLPLHLRTYDRIRSGAFPVDPVTAGSALVFCLLVGALVWGTFTGPPGVNGDTRDPEPGVSPDVGPGTASPSAATEPYREAGTAPAPGLSDDGIEDLRILGDAHERALRNRSYTLRLRFYRKNFSDPNATPTRVETDVLVDGDRYLVETALVVRGNRSPVKSVYYDGETLYSSQADALPGDRLVSLPYASGTPDEIRRSLIRRYLSTSRTQAIRVSQQTAYRVVGRGPPPATVADGTGVRDYTVIALVTAEGLVRRGTAEYTVLSGTGLYDVRFAWRYVRVNDTAVDPPQWYVEGVKTRNVAASDADG